MLKPEIRDPQGEAIASACHRLGYENVTSVRQGKRFEVEITGSPEERRAQVSKIAAELLANPVIEEFDLHAE
jgi:phosphoribosylformylglycinamidine synthase